MKKTYAWVIAALLATTLAGCSGPSPTNKANPVAPDPEFVPPPPTVPQSYNTALEQVAAHNFKDAMSNFDITTDQNPGNLYGYQAQVVKSYLISADRTAIYYMLEGVRKKMEGPDTRADEDRKWLEDTIASKERTLQELEPKWKRLEAIGKKRVTDLTAAEQAEMDDYEFYRDQVELTRRTLEEDRKKLAAMPAEAQAKQKGYAELEARLLKDEKGLEAEYDKTMRKLLQVFPNESIKTYFQVGYQPKEKLTKINAPTEMEKYSMPAKMEDLAKGNFEKYTYESVRAHLQQNFFKEIISYNFDNKDELFYVKFFYGAGRSYEEDDPAMARSLYEKALEITKKYEGVDPKNLKTAESMVYDARQEVLARMK